MMSEHFQEIANSVIGMTIEEAEKTVKEHKGCVRIGSVDDQPCGLTTDYWPYRITIGVKDGKVVEAEVG